jgi:SAM-dependent methyltransferase
MAEDSDHVSLADAYALETPDDNRRLYARWAPTYESEFVVDNRYVIPARVAEVFATVATDFRTGDPILDVGCGTGLVGQSLAEMCPPATVIDGVDISAAMLAAAASKRRANGEPLYRSLTEADLTAAVPIADGTYAGFVSAGTFTHGHLGPEALCGLIRFGRVGALFAIGINAEHFQARGFALALRAEVAAGTITNVEPHIVSMYLPGSPHFGDTAVVAVFTRAG